MREITGQGLGQINKFGDLEFKLFSSQFKNKFYPKYLICTAL